MDKVLIRKESTVRSTNEEGSTSEWVIQEGLTDIVYRRRRINGRIVNMGRFSGRIVYNGRIYDPRKVYPS